MLKCWGGLGKNYWVRDLENYGKMLGYLLCCYFFVFIFRSYLEVENILERCGVDYLLRIWGKCGYFFIKFLVLGGYGVGGLLGIWGIFKVLYRRVSIRCCLSWEGEGFENKFLI